MIKTTKKQFNKKNGIFMDKLENRFRSLVVNEDDIINDCIMLSFVSAEPYLRSFGWEILDLERSDFTFINSGNAPFLLDHNLDNHNYQIGVVEKAYIENEQGIAEIRFSTDPEKSGIINDIKAGIRTNISVGYKPSNPIKLDYQIEGKDVYSFAFAPHEISSVSVPADTTVGTNRADEVVELDVKNSSINNDIQIKNVEVLINQKEIKNMETVIDHAAVLATAVKEATKRASDIQEFCTKFSVAERAVEFINSAKTLAEVKEEVLAAVESRTAVVTVASPVSMFNIASSEKPTFSYARAMAAATSGDWTAAGFEREMSQERSKTGNRGWDKHSFFIDPLETRATALTPANAAQASGFGQQLVGSTYMPERLVDALWNKTFLDKVGADKMLGLTGNASFPVINSNMVATFVAETADIGAPQALGTAVKTVSPKELIVKGAYSKQAFIQTQPNIEAKIIDQIFQAIAQKLDAAVLSNSGTTLSTTGLLNDITNVVAMGTNGLAITDLASFVALRKLLIANKVDADQAKLLISSALYESLSTTKKTSADTASNFMINEGQKTIKGNELVWSQNVPSNLVKGTSGAVCSAAILGNFSDLLIAQWGNIEVAIDPYTAADTSQVVVRSYSFWDAAIKRVESFAVIKDILTP
jgi:HK97 family phage major capsid protein